MVMDRESLSGLQLVAPEDLVVSDAEDYLATSSAGGIADEDTLAAVDSEPTTLDPTTTSPGADADDGDRVSFPWENERQSRANKVKGGVLLVLAAIVAGVLIALVGGTLLKPAPGGTAQAGDVPLGAGDVDRHDDSEISDDEPVAAAPAATASAQSSSNKASSALAGLGHSEAASALEKPAAPETANDSSSTSPDPSGEKIDTSTTAPKPVSTAVDSQPAPKSASPKPAAPKAAAPKSAPKPAAPRPRRPPAPKPASSDPFADRL